ncbi:MAG: hypothetical protein MRY83_01510 [Flavobacteriales bacterium]|nr:hypothetical protein [Flavobacteriales bacterium]
MFSNLEDLVAMAFLAQVIVFCALERVDNNKNLQEYNKEHPNTRTRIYSSILSLHELLYRRKLLGELNPELCIERIKQELPHVLSFFKLDLIDLDFFYYLISPVKKERNDDVESYTYEDAEIIFGSQIDKDIYLQEYIRYYQNLHKIGDTMYPYRKKAWKNFL